MPTPEFFNRFCLFGALALLFNASVFAEERAVPTTYSSWLDAVNVPYAWNLGFTGHNAVVGIIDDSVDMDHPFYGSQIDRRLAYNTGVLYNEPVFKEFLPTLPEQSPNDTSAVWERATVLYNGASKEAISDNDCHGTSVTGCIAAYDSATNTYGSAYNATLVPIRIDFACQNFNAEIAPGIPYREFDLGEALVYRNDVIDIKNNCYGRAMGYIGSGSDLNLDEINDARLNNTLLLFSSGNERDGHFFSDSKDSSKKVYTAHPYTITVAATGKNNTTDYTAHAEFSDYGSCVFICAPGVGIQTSDREDIKTGNVFTYDCQFVADSEYQGFAVGNVLDEFNGTSASCPVATGVIALAIGAYRDTYPGQVCDARYIKHLLVRTSTKIDTEATKSPVAWTRNAAGISFSPSYGFGQINAGGLIDAILTPEAVLDGWANSVTEQSIATINWATTEVSPDEKLIYRSSLKEMNYTDDAVYSTRYSSSENGILAAAAENQTGTEAYVTLSEIQPLAASPSQLVYTQTQTITEDTFLNAGIEKQNLEEVVVTLTITGNDEERGFDARYLEITLDHDGCESILAFPDKKSFYHYLDTLTWSFSSNAFWGEDPTGDWTLNVYNVGGDTPFTVSDVYSTFYMGDLRYIDANAMPEPATWVMLLLGAAGVMYWRKK